VFSAVFSNAFVDLTFPAGFACWMAMAMTEKPPPNAVSGIADRKRLSADGPRQGLAPAAKRALAEAQARRVEIDRRSKEQSKELHGRRGPDPARYGDWEVKGIASDF
jgi:hypothetical protein